jgi:hypothetical protein
MNVNEFIVRSMWWYSWTRGFFQRWNTCTCLLLAETFSTSSPDLLHVKTCQKCFSKESQRSVVSGSKNQKTLKIWKVSDIRTDGQTDAVHFSIRKAQLSLCLGWAKKKGRYRSGKINFFFFFQCLPCLYETYFKKTKYCIITGLDQNFLLILLVFER